MSDRDVRPPKLHPTRELDSTPELGPLASAWLAERRFVRDPSATTDRATLAALLAERGLPAPEAVFEFETRFGGARFTQLGRLPGVDFVLGAYALLKDDGATPNRKRGFVPIVLSDNDVWYFVDAEGTVWAQDTIEDPEPVPFATTPSIALARLVSYLHVFDVQHAHGHVEHDGYCGASLARELGLPAIEHASDRYARFWGGSSVPSPDDSFVIEHEIEGEPVTMVVGPAVETLASE
ncbi:MAG: hypothetical protein MUE69_24265 [Myxococcota bacterium]|jgi:hypothetical protein|nr:hypothetical protein [Myxococcota bacterium]